MTSTYASTYTVADVRKVVDMFAAELDMIAQSTGLMSQGRVDGVVHDIKALGEAGYVASVDVVLTDAAEAPVCAQKYTVSTDAGSWATQRPGSSLWPRTPGGTVAVVVNYTRAWASLTSEQQATFRRDKLERSWGATDIDTTYPTLAQQPDRLYSSNSYGLRRSTFT